MSDSDDTRDGHEAEEERAKLRADEARRKRLAAARERMQGAHEPAEQAATKPSDPEARRKWLEARREELKRKVEERKKQLEALREERRRQRQAGRRGAAKPNDDEERRKREEDLRQRRPRRPKAVDYKPLGDQPPEFDEEDEAIIEKIYAELSLAFFAETKVGHARVSEALKRASGAEREALLTQLAQYEGVLEGFRLAHERKAAARAEAARRAAEE